MSITDEMNNELERMFDQGVAHERGRIRRATMNVRNRLVRVKAAALDASDKEFWQNCIAELDAATRAPKRRKRP